MKNIILFLFHKTVLLVKDPLFLCLLFLSAGQTIVRFLLLQNIDFVGYNDAAAYGVVAWNVLCSHGLTVDFVDSYHALSSSPLPFPLVTDHWFSLIVYCISFFMLFLGKQALAVKLPSLVAYFLYPLLFFILGKIIKEKMAGFFCGLTILLHPIFMDLAMTGYPDHVFNSCALLILILFFLIERYPPLIILCGFMAGLLLLIKSLAILFISSLFLLWFFRRKQFNGVPKRYYLLGFLSGGLVMSPLLLRNLVTFHDPSLSYYRNLILTLGFGSNAYEDHYRVFWNGPPTWKRLIEEQGISGFLNRGLETFIDAFSGNYYFSYQPGMPELMLSLPLFILALVALVIEWKGTVIVRFTVILGSVTLLFTSFFFAYQYRYFLLVISFLFFSVFILLFKIPRYLRNRTGSISVSPWWNVVPSMILVIFLFVFFTVPHLRELSNDKGRSFPYGEDEFMMTLMEMVIVNTDRDARIFSSLPAPINFHTNRRTFNVPYGTIGDMIVIGRKYTVHYYLDVVGKSYYFLRHSSFFQLVDVYDNHYQQGYLYRIILDTEESMISEKELLQPNGFMFPSSMAKGQKPSG